MPPILLLPFQKRLSSVCVLLTSVFWVPVYIYLVGAQIHVPTAQKEESKGLAGCCFSGEHLSYILGWQYPLFCLADSLTEGDDSGLNFKLQTKVLFVWARSTIVWCRSMSGVTG